MTIKQPISQLSAKKGHTWIKAKNRQETTYAAPRLYSRRFLNEVTGRVLGLLRAGQVNLNDQAILARLGAAPRSTVLIVVFLAPVVEEALFRGYVFGNLREYSRGAAYVVSCLFFASIDVGQFVRDKSTVSKYYGMLSIYS